MSQFNLSAFFDTKKVYTVEPVDQVSKVIFTKLGIEIMYFDDRQVVDDFLHLLQAIAGARKVNLHVTARNVIRKDKAGTELLNIMNLYRNEFNPTATVPHEGQPEQEQPKSKLEAVKEEQ